MYEQYREVYDWCDRVGPVEVEPVVARSLEDQLRVNLDTSSDDSGSEEDSDHLPLEWEAVRITLLPYSPVILQREAILFLFAYDTTLLISNKCTLRI